MTSRTSPTRRPRLGRELALLEHEVTQIGEESTLRQRFVEAMNRFLDGVGLAKLGVGAVLDERLVRGRPDARIGAVLFEVKLPPPAGPGLVAAIAQAKGYLVESRQRFSGRPCRAVAYDGTRMALLDEDGAIVLEGPPSRVAARLESWLLTLGGTVVTPEDFVARLGPESPVAAQAVGELWDLFQGFRGRLGFVQEVFEVWQGLYGVTTNLNEEARNGLSRAAQAIGLSVDTSRAETERYLFIVETYLGLLLKLLVARVAVQQRLTAHTSVAALLQQRGGPIAALRDLSTLVPSVVGVFEEDVFLWPAEVAAHDQAAEAAINDSLRDIAENIDDVDLVGVSQDFLRLVYQRFLDRASRRALGEFFTRPELVNEALDAIGYSGQVGVRLADPACGSGTFLVEAIRRFRTQHRHLRGAALLQAITDAIVGIDIHPFAVAMARVNYILAVGDLLPSPTPFRIPIYWADSLLRLAPAGATMPGMRPTVQASIPGLGNFALPDHHDIDWNDLFQRVAQAIAPFRGPLDPEAVWTRFWQAAPQQSYLPYDDTIKRLLSQIVERHNGNRDMRWLPLLRNALSVDQLRGACDFVVGNPPWVRIHNIESGIRQRLFDQYTFFKDAGWRRGAALGGAGRGFARQADYSLAFVERGLEFLRPGGRLAFVITSKVMHALYGNALRKHLVSNTRLLTLIDYSLHAQPLFLDATNYPLILGLEVGEPPEGHQVAVTVVGPSGQRRQFALPQAQLPLLPTAPTEPTGAESPWALAWPAVRQAFAKMQAAPNGRRRPLLGEFPEHKPQMGVKTSLNSVFIVKRVEDTDNPDEVVIYAEGYYDQRLDERQRPQYMARLERSLLRPLLRGADIEAWRYRARDWILWTHDDETGKVLPDLPPRAKAYFQRHERALKGRDDYRQNMPIWQIFRVSPEKLGPKVAWPELSSILECVYVSGVAAPIGIQTAYIVPVEDAQ